MQQDGVATLCPTSGGSEREAAAQAGRQEEGGWSEEGQRKAVIQLVSAHVSLALALSVPRGG